MELFFSYSRAISWATDFRVVLSSRVLLVLTSSFFLIKPIHHNTTWCMTMYIFSQPINIGRLPIVTRLRCWLQADGQVHMRCRGAVRADAGAYRCCSRRLHTGDGSGGIRVRGGPSVALRVRAHRQKHPHVRHRQAHEVRQEFRAGDACSAGKPMRDRYREMARVGSRMREWRG